MLNEHLKKIRRQIRTTFKIARLGYNYSLYVLKSLYGVIILKKSPKQTNDVPKITKNTITNLPLEVAICLPAHNEAKNIFNILEGLCNQKNEKVKINRVVVVSSASTDGTNEIVNNYKKEHPCVKLIRQDTREGKASAINLFLKQTKEPVVILQSTDTIPTMTTIEELCKPFINDPSIGLTGGAPIPVNDRNCFVGYVVHMWWWFHRNIPRFGEIIAFRNVIGTISPTTAVDEAYIQAKIIQLGYKAVHVEKAIIYNKGPETVSDLIKQRRRIFNGHSRLMQEEGIKIDNMTMSSLLLLLRYKPKNIKQSLWFLGGIFIELWARLLGAYDSQINNTNPFIWDTAHTTKNLAFVPDEDGDDEKVISESDQELAEEFIS